MAAFVILFVLPIRSFSHLVVKANNLDELLSDQIWLPLSVRAAGRGRASPNERLWPFGNEDLKLIGRILMNVDKHR